MAMVLGMALWVATVASAAAPAAPHASAPLSSSAVKEGDDVADGRDGPARDGVARDGPARDGLAPDVVAREQAARDAAMLAGGVGGALLGAPIGGFGAGALFVGAILETMRSSGCEAEECEPFGYMLFFYTVPIALAGAAVSGVCGRLVGAWLGGELADADGSARPVDVAALDEPDRRR